MRKDDFDAQKQNPKIRNVGLDQKLKTERKIDIKIEQSSRT